MWTKPLCLTQLEEDPDFSAKVNVSVLTNLRGNLQLFSQHRSNFFLPSQSQIPCNGMNNVKVRLPKKLDLTEGHKCSFLVKGSHKNHFKMLLPSDPLRSSVSHGHTKGTKINSFSYLHLGNAPTLPCVYVCVYVCVCVVWEDEWVLLQIL